MNPLPSRMESFWIGVVLGFVAALAFCPTPAKAADYIGVNTISRHTTGDHEKYNERNWGGFYEHWADDITGVQLGYYRNSFYEDTVYVVGILQPWRIGDVRLGGFIGPAWGYAKSPTILAGALVTVPLTERVAAQVIVNPAVFGLQFKFGF